MQDYRIAFFVNHEPVKFNGDYEYLDVKIEGMKITETEIEIENIKVGDFVYCIAVPLLSEEVAYKSASKLVIKEEAPQSEESNNTVNDPSINTSEELLPVFEMDGFLYARKYKSNILCKMSSDGEIKKTMDISNMELHVHDDKIFAIVSDKFEISDGEIITNDEFTITVKIFDMDFNELKSITVNSLFDDNTFVYLIDGNEENIVYVYQNKENIDELRMLNHTKFLK